MSLTLLGLFDLIGTVAFAISGAFVGIGKKMDIFGVNMLAMTTACGGGLMRDLIIGNTPPAMFMNPFYVLTALVVANIVFVFVYIRRSKSIPEKSIPGRVHVIYDRMLFVFDTLGLAAFTVDGVMVGVNAGYADKEFLLVFLGFMTGVGGGALRDIFADQMPDIFKKHVYALAAIAGGIAMVIVYTLTEVSRVAMIVGFLVVIVLRALAVRFNWNLPRID